MEYIKAHCTLPYSLVIGQRLIIRYEKPFKEKPPALWVRSQGKESRDSGVVTCQEAKSVGTQPSPGSARHADSNEHGTAQGKALRMDEPLSDIAHQLRFPFEM